MESGVQTGCNEKLMQAYNGIARRMNVGQLTACKMDIMNNSNNYISAKIYKLEHECNCIYTR